MNRLNGSQQEFIYRTERIFADRGYEEVNRESTPNGEFLLFTQNKALHLVYCLPYELYVTTMEIQACWEAQCKLGAKSSSVIAPYRFSEGAMDKAWKLDIELLVVEAVSHEAKDNLINS